MVANSDADVESARKDGCNILVVCVCVCVCVAVICYLFWFNHYLLQLLGSFVLVYSLCSKMAADVYFRFPRRLLRCWRNHLSLSIYIYIYVYVYIYIYMHTYIHMYTHV